MPKFDPLKLGAMLQQCARELPEGYHVTITVENGAGWTDLTDPKGEDLDYPCNREYGLVEQVTDALEFAKMHAVGE